MAVRASLTSAAAFAAFARAQALKQDRDGNREHDEMNYRHHEPGRIVESALIKNFASAHGGRDSLQDLISCHGA